MGIRQRATARELVKMGELAVPELEKAFDSIEKRGSQSEFATNAHWLIFAYAKMRGKAAYTKLRSMMGKPELDFLNTALDSSAALSLGLTSYVNGYSVPLRLSHVRCDRAEEPRDVLDQFILAWERNDSSLLDETLGPNARGALNSFLNGNSLEEMRPQIWEGRSGYGAAVGYRFEISGPWSQPEETLEPEIFEQRLHSQMKPPTNPEIETRFTNSSGGYCGSVRVRFSDIGLPTGLSKYSVDSSNLVELLRLVASCAAPPNKTP